MNKEVGKVIYKAIVENKWIDIKYNQNSGDTNFWIGIKDILEENKKIRILCKMLNPNINKKTKEVLLYLDKIVSATLITGSYNKCEKKLIDNINIFPEKYDWLDAQGISSNILNYLSECNIYDNDPYIAESVSIEGLTFDSLSKGIYQVSEKQMDELIDRLFNIHKEELKDYQKLSEICLSNFAISINNKKYVVAYRSLFVDFDNYTIVLDNKNTINKSFLIDGKKCNIYNYIQCDPTTFVDDYNSNPSYCRELIVKNLKPNEKPDTREEIFVLKRDYVCDLDKIYESVLTMEETSSITKPLLAFFGKNLSRRKAKNAEPYIVIKDKNTNPDQIRTIYNTMTNYVTYVEGPPGTGKTKTILNVILSAMANNQSCLICSNNNKPINDIYDSINFFYNNKKIIFPMIRLGNNDVNLEALNTISSFYNETKNIKEILTQKNIDNYKEKSLSIFKELKSNLDKYEQKQELLEELEKCNKVLLHDKKREKELYNKIKSSLEKLEKNDFLERFEKCEYILLNNKENGLLLLDEFKKTLFKFEQKDLVEKYKKTILHNIDVEEFICNEIKEINSKLDELKSIDEEMILNYVIPAEDNNDYMNYLFLESQSHIKKLCNASSKDLIDIVLMENKEEALRLFNQYLSVEENIKKFISIFPFVLTTNISANKLGSPKPIFDLCIMDEAGQCNIATSLVPIIRAKSLLLVGDIKQLKPVIVLEDNLNKKLMEKYHINDEYNYIQNSILNLMQNVDKNSKHIRLRYHYRCPKKIIDFCNKVFYEDTLIIKNDNEAKFEFINVENPKSDNNSYFEEAKQIVNVLIKHGYKDTMIVTPFRNQAELINNLLKEQGINDIVAGTIHTVQGAEKNTIILSAALSSKTAKRTFEWVKNNEQLINVGLSRAKKKFIMVGDYNAIKTLDNEENSIIYKLSNYVINNGDVKSIKNSFKKVDNLSNDSSAEKELYDTLIPYFNMKKNDFYIERNKKVSEVFGLKNSEYLDYYYKAEFDFVIMKKDIIDDIPKLIIELDGDEHIFLKKTIKRDRKKEIICGVQKVPILRVPNSLSKDYDYLIKCLSRILNTKKPKTVFDE